MHTLSLHDALPIYDLFFKLFILIYAVFLIYYKANNFDKYIYYFVLLYVCIMYLVSCKIKSYFIHVVCIQLILLELYITFTNKILYI